MSRSGRNHRARSVGAVLCVASVACAAAIGVGGGLALAGGGALGGASLSTAGIIGYAGAAGIIGTSSSVMLQAASEGSGIPSSRPDDADCSGELTDKVGTIANKTNRTVREIKDAIHRVKESMPRSGSRRNPDVLVDPKSGEVYPKMPSGRPGDSIGNIFEHLR